MYRYKCMRVQWLPMMIYVGTKQMYIHQHYIVTVELDSYLKRKRLITSRSTRRVHTNPQFGS